MDKATTEDRWSGSFQNSAIRLVLKPQMGGYTGVLTFNGVPLPLEARARGDGLEGFVAVGGQAMPFQATMAGRSMTFVTQDDVYVLEKQGGAPSAKAPEKLAHSPKPPAARETGLVGEWHSAGAAIRFGVDGMAVVNGESAQYAVRNNVLVLASAAGSIEVPFELNDDTLILTLAGQVVRLSRGSTSASTPDSGAPSARHLELAGKWCYQANVYAVNGGSSNATSCFTLNPDGTYEYHGLRDSSNPNGSATGEQYDAGTWTATETTITANSRYKGPATYRLEKVNHPKNGDPMLVLDGQAFYSYGQKAPWPETNTR